MNWTIIFNPFAKIASKKLMLFGVISFMIGCFISWRFRMIYDGILDVHSSPNITYIRSFISNGINVIFMCLLVYALGRIINPKTRMIDVLNASFLYRIPIYIIAILSSLPIQKEFEAKVLNNISNIQNLEFTTGELFYILLFSTTSMLLLAYAITLIVNGFKTASNAKKWQHFLSLGAVIIIAEILSKIFINLL